MTQRRQRPNAYRDTLWRTAIAIGIAGLIIYFIWLLGGQ